MLNDSFRRRPLAHFRQVSEFEKNVSAYQSATEATGGSMPESVRKPPGLVPDYGINARKASVPINQAEQLRRDTAPAEYDAAAQAEPGTARLAGPHATGTRFLHSVHANRRHLRPILQPIMQARRQVQ